MQSERLEGLRDTRKGGSVRPRTRKLSKEEIIEKQKAEIGNSVKRQVQTYPKHNKRSKEST